jgi:glutaminyl-tRNA synthetase
MQVQIAQRNTMTDIIEKPKHFIEQRIEADIEKGTYHGIVTRFPPEPSGFLHFGHAKAICLNFQMAKQYKGLCNLRFDDTNPAKEEKEFMDGMIDDIAWLGFKPDQVRHAADYFDQFYDGAITLINDGKAYVDSLSMSEMREYRGTLKTPGKNSPYRDRTPDENLDLFKRMADGEFDEGTHVLRAKIDMSAGNINMRDPVIYRILKKAHPHCEKLWNIYPMYDYAHCISDAIEGITHSLCSLEFQDHRPLYDWFVDALMPEPHPQQIEFSRLNVTHMLTSKRKLRYLVEQEKVNGWDDPRMSTLIAMRRRGFPPQAIRAFCKQVGISKSDSVIDMSVFEECVRDELNREAPRAFCVFNPINITITNYPDVQTELLEAPMHPQNDTMGTRTLPFSKHVVIDAEDFMENPPGKYRRLAPGKEVRLRYGYIIRCDEVVKDAQGNITELKCTYDKDTLGKNPEGRKVKGVIHWLSRAHAVPCEVRLYDRLFNVENPAAKSETNEDLLTLLNPDSLTEIKTALIEPELKEALPESRFQFERLGYYVADRFDSTSEHLVFNRIVNLRDTWKK